MDYFKDFVRYFGVAIILIVTTALAISLHLSQRRKRYYDDKRRSNVSE